MRRNLLAAFRTIFLLAFTIALIAGSINAWNAVPQVWLVYQVQSPGAAPLKVEHCDRDAAREYSYREGPDGARFNIELCFRAIRIGELKFIPYLTSRDEVAWIEFKGSPQVAAYTRTVARSFALSQADVESALGQWRRQQREARMDGFVQLAVTLLLFAACGSLLLWLAHRIAMPGRGMQFGRRFGLFLHRLTAGTFWK
ncbi:hypothetical protein D3870_21670 [Noviherbaspirillum cavernae]|uniref:Uncharacterized protein n=1 Tax=Noviherbaspirillum cavernae TaxID=2320862 RepID=A0A418WWD5_9BURK|nr:hypothetical protein [Noviherbaspirillum cavernae]RJF96967.1 hypothetical protein D3870_21670 [Noviherbaspirillum cavernae]